MAIHHATHFVPVMVVVSVVVIVVVMTIFQASHQLHRAVGSHTQPAEGTVVVPTVVIVVVVVIVVIEVVVVFLGREWKHVPVMASSRHMSNKQINYANSTPNARQAQFQTCQLCTPNAHQMHAKRTWRSETSSLQRALPFPRRMTWA